MFCMILAIVVHSGCIEDKCRAVRCENEAVCVNGECACLYGYEGSKCEELWMQKFTGQWSAADSSRFDTVAKEYDFNISSFRGLDTLLVTGFLGYMDTVIAVRKAHNKLDLLQRNVNDSALFQGGEATVNVRRDMVTGLYSFKNKDAVTTYYFTWAR
jgi:hypothetical protein